jgi:hypothetical protein
MSGKKTSTPTMKWAPARLPTTKGEKPKTRPPTSAAGVQCTQRRSNQNMARAEKAGPSVNATFKVATGPKSQVTGAKGMPMASTLVLASRLMPPGWNSAVEKKGLWPWASA